MMIFSFDAQCNFVFSIVPEGILKTLCQAEKLFQCSYLNFVKRDKKAFYINSLVSNNEHSAVHIIETSSSNETIQLEERRLNKLLFHIKSLWSIKLHD